MLSYRHAFHAGNHADILKHFVLFQVLEYFNRKDKPYWYIDTHSGAGLYHLNSNEANKVGEYRDGITRLQNTTTLPEPLNQFLCRLKTILPSENLYCGSPWLAQAITRTSDKLRLFELHPTDFQHLTHNMQEAKLNRRGIIKQEDGYQGLIALLPPTTRRAVVLIDPPYEDKSDYQKVVRTLKDALKRFEQGCYLIWYPCLSRADSQQLPEQLKKLLPHNYLQAELYVKNPSADGFGMHGSGMFILNPPYLLQTLLQETLPQLCEILAQDAGAKFVLNSQIA